MFRKGFTLIELLVVITILAILAGAALPYVQNYVDESRIAKAKTDLEEIARALAVYETREGDYEANNVSLLTGRYLNKSPIDPWGSQYVIATDSGVVYSKGPDRKDDDSADKYDNIIVPYQPPLALVSAKWVDKNQSGAVDTQNVADELHLNFSRKLATPVLDLGTLATHIQVSSDTPFLLSTIVGTGIQPNAKVVVYPINADNVFVAGRDSVTVLPSHDFIKDRADPKNNCLASQPVKILPQ